MYTNFVYSSCNLDCSGIAKDEGASDSLVVENDNGPRDTLAQQADKGRLDQLQCVYSKETTW